ncbi:hypothetical protein [Sabulicella rubraurantiaca]|uniref:hypothetical protein n=1 Tax=Sabulicella rubraurantiaca TaxID=2811429 RepID=UPI001A970CC0|nr:hypothetical protein [Sabulicella rubraurantiaca]
MLLPLWCWSQRSLEPGNLNQQSVAMAYKPYPRAADWVFITGLTASAILFSAAVGRVAEAQSQTDPPSNASPSGFIEIVPAEGRAPVHLATSQVVRVGRVENFTTIDTAAWVQQRTIEPAEALARRLRSAGQRLVTLTDLNHGRVYLALDRIVLVRDSNERHAAGARAAIVMVGLRFNTDIAVRETAQEVMAAIRREGHMPISGPQPAAP